MNKIPTAETSYRVRPSEQDDSGGVGFPVDLISRVLCPKDSGRLLLGSTEVRSCILQGWVQCDTCGSSYEIRSGILRLMPGQGEIEELVRAEQDARDRGAARYDGRFRPWENAIELSAIRSAVSFSRRGIMVDLACGTGRLTTQLAPLAEATIAVDLSENSLRILAKKLEPGMKVGLVWSDATQLCLAPDSIDWALATQFLEHIPNRAQRLRFFTRIHTALRDGGELVLSAYYYSALRALLRRKQEGFHANGIFYHRFTKSEIKSELAGQFQILWTRPIQTDPRLLPVSNRAITLFAMCLEKIGVPFWVGQLLLVRARKHAAGLGRMNGHGVQWAKQGVKACDP